MCRKTPAINCTTLTAYRKTPAINCTTLTACRKTPAINCTTLTVCSKTPAINCTTLAACRKTPAMYCTTLTVCRKTPAIYRLQAFFIFFVCFEKIYCSINKYFLFCSKLNNEILKLYKLQTSFLNLDLKGLKGLRGLFPSFFNHKNPFKSWFRHSNRSN